LPAQDEQAQNTVLLDEYEDSAFVKHGAPRRRLAAASAAQMPRN
jgi:hypothetical protein